MAAQANPAVGGINQNQNNNSIIVPVSFSAGFGYIIARYFTSINPVGGAIFNGSSALITLLASKVSTAANARIQTNGASILKFLFSNIAAFYITRHFVQITVGEIITLTSAQACVLLLFLGFLSK